MSLKDFFFGEQPEPKLSDMFHRDGYHLADAKDKSDNYVPCATCDRCGAVVVDYDQHDRFHMGVAAMTDTTQLNREIAALLGWEEITGDGYQEFAVYWSSGNALQSVVFDGSAWADSADVALRELMPLLVGWTIVMGQVEATSDKRVSMMTPAPDIIEAVTSIEDDWNSALAIAICNAAKEALGERVEQLERKNKILNDLYYSGLSRRKDG